MNIVQFSKKANVSTATVSRAFHEPQKLLPATCARILALADKFGYYPNPAGRALVRGRHDVIGLIWPIEVEGVEAHFAHRILALLTNQLVKNDLDLLICPIDRNAPGTLAHAKRTLRRASCDAWMLLYPRPEDELIEALNNCGKAVVSFMGRIAGTSSWQYVCLSQDDWMKDCLLRLRKSGSKRIFFFGGRNAEPDHLQRLESFWKLAPGYFGNRVFSLFGWPAEKATFLDVLKKERIDGIIGADDAAALLALELCERAKLQVPGKVRVVGIDDTPASALSRPTLSTYRQPLSEMVERAIDLVLGKRARSAKFNATFIPRASLPG